MIVNMQTTNTLTLRYIKNSAAHQFTINYTSEYKVLDASDYIEYDVKDKNEYSRKCVYFDPANLEKALWYIIMQNNLYQFLTKHDWYILARIAIQLGEKQHTYVINYTEPDNKEHEVRIYFTDNYAVAYMSDTVYSIEAQDEDEYEYEDPDIHEYSYKNDIFDKLNEIYCTASLSKKDKRLILEFVGSTVAYR